MDDYAIVPSSASLGRLHDAPDGLDPVAEHNFSRKKLCTLEMGINKLQRTARQQHEVVSQIENGLKSMISETDLRRAIGLAFQEFDHRLEDAFQDSNRKCLAMFSKRDEVSDLQGLIGKKVNWKEYNTVLEKISELRKYLDTMAESIFIGHRDALNSEFAKKADKAAVEQTFTTKADLSDVYEVRARLERLEVLVAETDKRQSGKVAALRDEMDGKLRAQSGEQLAMITGNAAEIAALRDEHATFIERLGGAETEVGVLTAATERLRGRLEATVRRQEDVIVPTMTSMQEQLARMEDSAGSMQRDLGVLAGDATSFRDSAGQKFDSLSAQAGTCREQLEFLMQATEALKRGSRETKKANTSKFKDLDDEQERHAQQMAALERQLKRQERDARASSHSKTPRSMPELPLPPADPNDRLKGVLVQLERLSDGGAAPEQLGLAWSPERPTLPLPGGTVPGLDSELAGVTQVPIDSARGAPMSTQVRGIYGLSPRTMPTGAKAAKKKR